MRKPMISASAKFVVAALALCAFRIAYAEDYQINIQFKNLTASPATLSLDKSKTSPCIADPGPASFTVDAKKAHSITVKLPTTCQNFSVTWSFTQHRPKLGGNVTALLSYVEDTSAGKPRRGQLQIRKVVAPKGNPSYFFDGACGSSNTSCKKPTELPAGNSHVIITIPPLPVEVSEPILSRPHSIPHPN